jgi:hypothetical protein
MLRVATAKRPGVVDLFGLDMTTNSVGVSGFFRALLPPPAVANEPQEANNHQQPGARLGDGRHLGGFDEENGINILSATGKESTSIEKQGRHIRQGIVLDEIVVPEAQTSQCRIFNGGQEDRCGMHRGTHPARASQRKPMTSDTEKS